MIEMGTTCIKRTQKSQLPDCFTKMERARGRKVWLLPSRNLLFTMGENGGGEMRLGFGDSRMDGPETPDTTERQFWICKMRKVYLISHFSWTLPTTRGQFATRDVPYQICPMRSFVKNRRTSFKISTFCPALPRVQLQSRWKKKEEESVSEEWRGRVRPTD